MADAQGIEISLIAKVYGFNDLAPKKRKVKYKRKTSSPGHAFYIYSGDKLKQKVDVTPEVVRGYFLKEYRHIPAACKVFKGHQREAKEVLSLVLLYELTSFMLQVSSRVGKPSKHAQALRKLEGALDMELNQVASYEVHIDHNDCFHLLGVAHVYMSETHVCVSQTVSQWHSDPQNVPSVLATWPWCDVQWSPYRSPSGAEGLMLSLRMADHTAVKSWSFTCDSANEIFQRFREGFWKRCVRTNPFPLVTNEPPYINWSAISAIFNHDLGLRTRSLEYFPADNGSWDWDDSHLVSRKNILTKAPRSVPVTSWLKNCYSKRTLSLSENDFRRCLEPAIGVSSRETSTASGPAPTGLNRAQHTGNTTHGAGVMPRNPHTATQDAIAQSFVNWRKEQQPFWVHAPAGASCGSQQPTVAVSQQAEYDDLYHPLPNLVRILTSDCCREIPNRLQLSKRARQNLSLWLSKSGPHDQGSNWQDLAYRIGLQEDTVELLKKYEHGGLHDYLAGELVLKFWEFYSGVGSPITLADCSWGDLVTLLKDLERYDLVERLQRHRLRHS